jgi:hypothetical protein
MGKSTLLPTAYLRTLRHSKLSCLPSYFAYAQEGDIQKVIREFLRNNSASLIVLGIGIAISIAIAGGDVTAGTHRGR